MREVLKSRQRAATSGWIEEFIVHRPENLSLTPTRRAEERGTFSRVLMGNLQIVSTKMI
jgi:hypothetical protein